MHSLVVNGRSVELKVDPGMPLVLALRNHLGLRGVRPGCAIGECGACVVLADGHPIRSCQNSVAGVAGRSITTPEGLGTPDEPHPVQQAFLTEQAAQCGYCVNGMTMSVAALLASNPRPDDAEIIETLDGHLCRCGTHHRLLRAVRRLAGREIPPCFEVRTCPTAAAEPATGGAADAGGTGRAGSAKQAKGSESARSAGEPRAQPPALCTAPHVEHWLRPLPDGRVEVLSGRVELGQGVRTAFAQIVAAELGVSLEQVVVRSAATDATPDEGYTAGSMSLELGGLALARAAAAYRRLTEAGLPPTGPILDEDQPHEGTRTPLGSPAARSDLVAKLTGAPAYVHDLAFPGMLHARALLPPTYDARPAYLDLAAARELPGVEAVLHDGGLVVVVAAGEDQAVRAVDLLRRTARWDDPGLALPPAGRPGVENDSADWDRPGREWLRNLPATPYPVVGEPSVEAGLAEGLGAGRWVTASYSKPYEAHGSVAPSCAVAYTKAEHEAWPADAGEPADAGHMTVWTHSQGVFPLRRELAALLGEDESRLTVRHADGPGCYGHNGADDAAGFAALAARAVPGRHVRFQFSVQDELGWEPYGPPMLADLTAAFGNDGRVTAWRHVVRTDAHTARPHGSGDRLVVSWLRAGDVSHEGHPHANLLDEGALHPKPGAQVPARQSSQRYAGQSGERRNFRPWAGTGEGGVRSAVPLYDIPAREITGEYVRGPLRTSALRSLGAYLNLFAIESFVDELAAAAGRDPVAFRLAHLSDERARAVLEAACEAAGREAEAAGQAGSRRGQGVAVARYKGSKAYVAQVVDVEVHPSGAIAVRRVVTACDAGRVVNPDGLCNQLEGGTLQGLSRALYEQVRADPTGIRTRDWSTYAMLPFSAVPELYTIVLDRPGHPPLGAGEASTPVTPAALANAVADATGVRVRDLPIPHLLPPPSPQPSST